MPAMSLPRSPWRPFLTLTPTSGAAAASVCCHYSFATLEVACDHPGEESFALTERRQGDDWRWAVCNTKCLILRTGCEATQTEAKRVAEEALRLETAGH